MAFRSLASRTKCGCMVESPRTFVGSLASHDADSGWQYRCLTYCFIDQTSEGRSGLELYILELGPLLLLLFSNHLSKLWVPPFTVFKCEGIFFSAPPHVLFHMRRQEVRSYLDTSFYILLWPHLLILSYLATCFNFKRHTYKCLLLKFLYFYSPGHLSNELNCCLTHFVINWLL